MVLLGNVRDSLSICLSLSIIFVFREIGLLSGSELLREDYYTSIDEGSPKRGTMNDATRTTLHQNHHSEVAVALSPHEEETTRDKKKSYNKTKIKFSLEDHLDFTVPIDCGYNKCFFHSRKEEGKGYLVARSGGDQLTFQNMKQAWKDVQRLEEMLANATSTTSNAPLLPFRHFLAGPTKSVEIANNHTLTKMNELARGWWVDKAGRRSKAKSYYGSFEKSKRIFVLVQEIHIAPKPHLLVFCNPDQEHKTIQQISNFSTSIQNKESFLSTFDEEWDQLLVHQSTPSILQMEPRLWYDFQILVDTKGQIYHIDLDRTPNKNGNPKSKLKGAQKINKEISRMEQACSRTYAKIRQALVINI